MVFNFTSKKKKNSKIPKLNSKVQVQTNSQRNVTVTNNLILSPQPSQNFPDPSIYHQLSSNRAIFESHKLESACSFLKCLKEKLEKDVDEEKGSYFDNSTSETISDILDTLIDVSDNITPIISDVTESTKSIYRNTVSSDSSSVSEKHFNRTMTATNKLLEIAKNPKGIPTSMADGSYYFAQKIIANNLEELTIFKNNIKSVGDKIYVDRKLLAQLIELHSLLKDTITKLKNQEDKFLMDSKFRNELEKSRTFHAPEDWDTTPKHCQPLATSTPISKAPVSFHCDNYGPKEIGSTYVTAVSIPHYRKDKKSKRNSKEIGESPADPGTLTKSPEGNTEQDLSETFATAHGSPTKLTPESSAYITAQQSPSKLSPQLSMNTTIPGTPSKVASQSSAYITAREASGRISPESSVNINGNGTPCKITPEPNVYTSGRQTPSKMSPDSSAYLSSRQTPTKISAESSTNKSTRDTTLPTLPFDLASTISSVSDDQTLKTRKMKKKAIKASKLEFATLLTTDMPSDYTDYDSCSKIKEEVLNKESLSDTETTVKTEPPSPERTPSPKKLAEPHQPIAKVEPIVEEEPVPPEPEASQSTMLPECCTTEKTFADAGTEFSSSKLTFSPKLSLHKPVREKRDTKDVACCGAIKETKTNSTSMSLDSSTNTFRFPKRSIVTSTPIPKQTNFEESGTEMSRDMSIPMKSHKTQTQPRLPSHVEESVGDEERTPKGKIICRDCFARKKLFDSTESGNDTTLTKASRSPFSSFGRFTTLENGELSSSKKDSGNDTTPTKTSRSPLSSFGRFTTLENGGLSSTRKESGNDTTLTKTSRSPFSSFGRFTTLKNGELSSSRKADQISLPGYIEGLNKCIAELECMINCLRNAATTKKGVHECVKIYPETEAEFLSSSLPHFHTVIDGMPMIIQFNKERMPIDNTLRYDDVSCCRKGCTTMTADKASTCCRDQEMSRETSFTIKNHKTQTTSQLPSFAEESLGDGEKLRKTNGLSGTQKNDGNITVKSSKYAGYTPRERTRHFKGKHPFNESRNKEDYYTKKYISLTSMIVNDESSASIPYVADKDSLPKIDDPDKICSSLQFDVTTIPVTFKDTVLYHPKAYVNQALKHVNVEKLLDSFRPAKCCRKAVLNQKSRGPMPYAASLQSLPLMEGDVRKMTNIIYSNVPALFKTQTLFEHYVHFQNKIMTSHNKDTFVTPTTEGRAFQVYFFEFFKRDDDEKSNDSNPSKSNSNNTLHDLRILDFIKRIYTTEPIYDKTSKKYSHHAYKEDGDKEVKSEKDTKSRKEKPHERHRDRKKLSDRGSSSRQSKHRKTETKSYFTSVESYSSSKSNFHLNSSSSSATSKYTSRNSNSMYSFLLIPKSQVDTSLSCNDLSTSYAPSVNSLPFDDEVENVFTSTNCTRHNLARASSEESEEWLLSPKNYAQTLDGIYELDEHGNIRIKGNTNLKENNDEAIIDSMIVPFIQSRHDLPSNARNLSTIYETDEKSVNKESDASLYRMPPSKSYSSNRSKSVSPRSSDINQSNSKSRIPISIRSYSASAVHKEKINNANTLPKSSTTCNKSSISSCTMNDVKSMESKEFATVSKLAKIPLQSTINVCNINSYKNVNKNLPRYVDAATSTNDIYKDLIARVHPKVIGRQINTKPNSINNKSSIGLQKVLDGTNNFELPITFEIVKPVNNANRNIKMERKVMSFDNESLSRASGIRDKRRELKYCRPENSNGWPQLQKRFQSENKALFLSIHRSRHNTSEQSKTPDLPSKIRILQQHPSNKTINHTVTGPQNINRSKELSKENFTTIHIESERESKSILKQPSSHERTRSSKHKKKVKHISPEVIDIKVSKHIKSTKLKDRLFKDGERPGYVTVLSTPCNCPDITIFLPCCCGYNDCCGISKHSFVRQAQQYAMVPIAQKDRQK